MKGQKEAVVSTLLSVLAERGVEYEQNGEVIMKDILTPDDKAKVREQIIAGFIAGEIQISDDARTKHTANGFVSYTNGLVNNWIKKNPAFNAGQKYIPTNPGSRAGQGDDTIKALRGLLKGEQTAEAIIEINQAIAQRLAEIKPSSVVEINVDHLPESLRHLVKA